MDDLEVALQAARAAADVVRPSTAGVVEYKSDDSPVTRIDGAAEAAMLAVLSRARPDDAVVAEESGSAGGGHRRWYLDPLDGTVNFINGIPQVGVSVGLWDGGQPAVGVVLDVYRGDEFTAVAGEGSFINGAALRSSQRADLRSAVVATGFPYDHRQQSERLTVALRHVLERVQGVRRFGSAALDLAWTAAGRYDGYYETGISPWDVAAGIILVTEAGGTVTNFAGAPATPTDASIVAAGSGLHEALRTLVVAGFS